MKRFLSRFTRASGDKGHTDQIDPQLLTAEAESAETGASPPDADDAPFEFELREPTDEELNASFLSKQDFLDLDRVMAAGIGRMGAAAPKPAPIVTLAPAPIPQSPAPPTETTTPAPAEVKPAPAAETLPATAPSDEKATPSADDGVAVPAAPDTAIAAAPPEQPPAPVPVPAPPVSDGPEEHLPQPVVAAAEDKPKPAKPAKPPKHRKPADTPSAEPRTLVGFWDGLAVGQSLQGWAGDSHDPACRSVQITLIVDGKEAGSTLADGNRTDTPHGAFMLPFADPAIAQYIIEDRVRLRATHGDLPPLELLMLPSVLDTARIHRTRELEKAGTLIGNLAPIPKTVGDLSLFRLPVGLESTDGAAITGKEGYLFAHRGPHDVSGHFADRTSPKIETDAEGWLALFRGRQAAIARRKAVYVQSILPEKATILHQLTPPGSPQITARLSLLEAHIADQLRMDDSAFPYYRSLVSALRACHAAGISPFLRTDDGMRSIGAQLCFYQIVQQISGLVTERDEQFARITALCGQIAPAGREGAPFTGGLARHFSFPMYETELRPDHGEIEAMLPGPATTETREGGIVRSTWHNPGAPCDLKILAFGAVDDGASNRSLNWWLKAMFRDVSVVQSVELDLSLVNRWRPDVVLCLDRERMLRTVPAR